MRQKIRSNRPSWAEIGQQIELLEFDHGADVRRDLPQLADLAEMFDQKLDRQAALHFELAVEAGPRLFQNVVGQVGRQQLDAPAGDFAFHLVEAHRERIRLLAGGGGRAPNADGARTLRRAAISAGMMV